MAQGSVVSVPGPDPLPTEQKRELLVVVIWCERLRLLLAALASREQRVCPCALSSRCIWSLSVSGTNLWCGLL